IGSESSHRIRSRRQRGSLELPTPILAASEVGSPVAILTGRDVREKGPWIRSRAPQVALDVDDSTGWLPGGLPRNGSRRPGGRRAGARPDVVVDERRG